LVFESDYIHELMVVNGAIKKVAGLSNEKSYLSLASQKPTVCCN